MIEKSKWLLLPTAIIMLLFILASAGMFGPAIPLLAIVSLIMAGILVSFIDMKPLWKILFIIVPLSVNVELVREGTKIIIPSELLAGILAIAFVLHIVFRPIRSKELLAHPVTLLILAYLVVMAFTTLTSEMKMVSAKYLIVQSCYIIVFYLMAYELFKTNEQNKAKVIWYYSLAISIVILYSLYNHSFYDFTKDTSGVVSKPFYNDHTIFSACIAMIIPFFIYFFTIRFRQQSLIKTGFSGLIIILLLVVIYTAASRAAWLSLVVAGVFAVAVYIFRFRFLHFAILIAFGTVLVLINRNPIYESLRNSKFDSSAKFASFGEQTRSIISISNDKSNAERINRWNCAIRMFKDRPVTGFGPGTYAHQYIPYQIKSEMTVISVDSPYDIPEGRGGTAHSEYFLALSENGIFGFLLFLALPFVVFYSGLRSYYRMKDKYRRGMILAAMTALMTYFSHGLFNNFLDTDKSAILFWGLIAMIVNWDIKSKPIKDEKK